MEQLTQILQTHKLLSEKPTGAYALGDHISTLTPTLDEFRKRFTIRYDQTLFGSNWNALLETRCPWCANRLKLSQKGLYICSGVKHKKSFVIKEELFKDIVKELEK